MIWKRGKDEAPEEPQELAYEAGADGEPEGDYDGDYAEYGEYDDEDGE